MHVSLSEIETTVCKAGWAAGLALGLGEDAGRNARRLTALGLPALGAYADALEWLQDGQSSPLNPNAAARGSFTPLDPTKLLSALHAGPAARDFLQAGNLDSSIRSMTLHKVDRPLVIIGELLEASAALETEICFSAISTQVSGALRNEQLALCRGTVELLIGSGPDDVEVSCGPAAGRKNLAEAVPMNGLSVDASHWQRLTRLAAKRLVAASEASRLQGAGAGLVDRD